MAIFSLHHAPVGKSTQAKPHTAAAHVRYITRKRAMSRMDSERLPYRTPDDIASHLRKMEDGDRKNARVIDKVMLALPKELNAAQRAELVRSFAEEATQGRAPWLAAFHDKGKDAANPHCHLVIRDRDPDTGRRVIGTSEAGSTERLRLLWEVHANRALEAAGRAERIDRRTLEAQGVERAPGIHEGPKARATIRRGLTPRSRLRTFRNPAKTRTRARQVDYARLDNGKTRVSHNAELRRANGVCETEADLWAAMDADKLRRDFESLGYGADFRRLAEQGRLMDLIARLPVEVSETRSGLNLPLQPERRTIGVDFGPSAFEPSPDRVGRGKGHDERADALAKVPDTGGENVIKHAQQETHIIDNGINEEVRKEIVMADEEKRRYLESIKSNAEQQKAFIDGRLKNELEKSYLNPEAAQKKFEKLRAEKGEQAAIEKLETNPMSFGRRPGSILSVDGYRPGATGRQNDATEARKKLPDLYREQAQLRDRAAGANRGLLEMGAPPTPQIGGPGSPASGPEHTPQVASAPEKRPSFSEKLAQKTQDFSKSLEQMKREREKDKERGR